MPNKQQQTQVQGQEMVQKQKLTQQQLLLVRLTELPLASLEERVKDEVDTNDALEAGRIDDVEGGEGNEGEGVDDGYDVDTEDTADEGYTSEEIMETLDPNGNEIGYYSDDDVNIANHGVEKNSEVPIGDTGSFIEDMLTQIGEYDVDEDTRYLLEYLIGSLNNNGFIEKSLFDISNELAFYHNRDVPEKEVERALHILQQFDPPGIGARDLRECLLLQIDRILSQLPKAENDTVQKKRSLLELERKVLSDYYTPFVNKNFDKIMEGLGLTSGEMSAVVEGVSHLNPRPGIALNESASDTVMTVIPDFIIEIEEGEVRMRLNEGNIPPLHIRRDYIDKLKNCEKSGKTLPPWEKEGYAYMKQNADSAKMFIEAINQRRHTLYKTMKAIIELQKEFFLTQDDDQLRPMILQDVANRAKLDISTVSRVCNSKYATIDGCVYPLKHFFSRARTNAEGEDINIRKVKNEIQRLVDEEDKSKPLPDEAITEMLKALNYNVSRRTVAKYRDQMNIPKARLRKEITT